VKSIKNKKLIFDSVFRTKKGVYIVDIYPDLFWLEGAKNE